MESSASAQEFWLHDLSPFLFQLGESGFGIRYYGLAYVLGFLSGLWLLGRYHRGGLSPFDDNRRIDVFFTLIVGVILGGRLGYLLFYQPVVDLVRDPLTLFRVWEGGMASHGGFLGVFLAELYVARRHRQPFWKVSDLICTLAPAGLLFGRIANFINGELWGRASTISWAVIFPDDPNRLPRHPSQLYEAALEGLFMLLYSQWRIWKTPVLKETPGQLTGEFLTLYSIVRIIGEQFREPDYGDPLTFGLSKGTALSIVMGSIGLAIAITARMRAKRKQTPPNAN